MKKLCMCLLAALLAVAPLLFSNGAGPAVAGERKVDAATGATPNFRTFLETDLKSIQKVREDASNPGTFLTGGLEGGHYTCLKAQEPFTYFEQDWYGLSLAYLLDSEVGMKADTTGVKIWAGDDYSITLTLDQIRNPNPDGLRTILAWKKGKEGETGKALTELDADEGPFRLVVPQETVGPHGVGTPNWNLAVMQVRAIEVQPVQTGLPPVVPGSIPDGQVAVYGNILSRRTFTMDRLKSISPVTDSYSWKTNLPEYGTSDCTGILLPDLLDRVVGALDDAKGVRAWAGDGFKRNWTMEEVRDTYLDDTKFMLAWNIDGEDLTPEPDGDGPIRLVKPQADPEETNMSRWVTNIRAVQLYTTDNPDDDPLGFLSEMVPNDRIIVSGAADPNNIPSVWYLAEGYTGGGFEEWITIQNPNPWKTHVIVDYMLEGEEPRQQELDVNAMSRTNIRVNDQVGDNKNVSARVEGYHGDSLMVERAMYWNGRDGGHCAAGVNSPGTEWFLAEGCTGGGFETWVLVQNPGAEPANVALTYMTESGRVKGPEYAMPPRSRKTFNVADTLPDNWQVSTKVTSSKPVIAERAIYWSGRSGGHCAAGVNSPGTEWYLAEGSTGGGFETWVLLQNPGDAAAKATITYMNAGGTQAGPVVDLPAGSRKTVNVADTLPEDWQVSTKVTCNKPVVVERAMYWSGRAGGHCENGVDSPKFRSFLAEGATDGGFESWILIQNPGAVDATVYVTYLTAEGAVERAPLQVKAGKRVSVNEADDVGANYQVSATVSSTAAVSVERAVYWSGRSDGSCSRGHLTW